MVDKVNGHVLAGESLTGNIDFFTLTTSVNILASDNGGNPASQARLDKLVEVISLRGQPIIMGTPFTASSNYVFKFAIEHTGAWEGVTPSLVNAIELHAGHLGFTASNTSVGVSARL
jgi:hypothetical protein